MLSALRLLTLALGASAVLIAASILLFGPGATAAAFERAYAALTGWPGAGEGPWPATMDSELRFYAALWGGYGGLLIQAARRLPARLAWTPWLAAVFFAGGVGRMISRAAVGPPHPFFTVLMVVELVLPPVLVGLWIGARREAG
jgi:hypothetical protein